MFPLNNTTKYKQNTVNIHHSLHYVQGTGCWHGFDKNRDERNGTRCQKNTTVPIIYSVITQIQIGKQLFTVEKMRARLRPWCYLISGPPPFLASSLLSTSGERVMLEGA